MWLRALKFGEEEELLEVGKTWWFGAPCCLSVWGPGGPAGVGGRHEVKPCFFLIFKNFLKELVRGHRITELDP